MSKNLLGTRFRLPADPDNIRVIDGVTSEGVYLVNVIYPDGREEFGGVYDIGALREKLESGEYPKVQKEEK